MPKEHPPSPNLPKWQTVVNPWQCQRSVAGTLLGSQVNWHVGKLEYSFGKTRSSSGQRVWVLINLVKSHCSITIVGLLNKPKLPLSNMTQTESKAPRSLQRGIYKALHKDPAPELGRHMNDLLRSLKKPGTFSHSCTLGSIAQQAKLHFCTVSPISLTLRVVSRFPVFFVCLDFLRFVLSILLWSSFRVLCYATEEPKMIKAWKQG